MCIGKTLVRLAVIAGVVGGVGLLAAQSPRARALMHQAHQTVSNKIDRVIDDPVALRAQLRELEMKYPQRIASVRSDLAEVTAQVSELEHEMQVASKVVELAAADLEVGEEAVVVAARRALAAIVERQVREAQGEGLAPEARDELQLAQGRGEQALERDLAPARAVAGAEDLPHAAAAELAQEGVASQVPVHPRSVTGRARSRSRTPTC